MSQSSFLIQCISLLQGTKKVYEVITRLQKSNLLIDVWKGFSLEGFSLEFLID